MKANKMRREEALQTVHDDGKLRITEATNNTNNKHTRPRGITTRRRQINVNSKGYVEHISYT